MVLFSFLLCPRSPNRDSDTVTSTATVSVYSFFSAMQPITISICQHMPSSVCHSGVIKSKQNSIRKTFRHNDDYEVVVLCRLWHRNESFVTAFAAPSFSFVFLFLFFSIFSSLFIQIVATHCPMHRPILCNPFVVILWVFYLCLCSWKLATQSFNTTIWTNMIIWYHFE